jgi:hypothetical protein
VALIQGRFADVESLAVAADEALAAAGYQWFGPLLASTALAAKLAIGDWAGADRWLERTKAEGLDAFGSTDLSRWLLWLRVCALRRDHEVVRIEVERHPARIDGRIVPMLGTTQLLSVLVDLGDLVGVPLPSARLERRLGRASSGGLVIIEGNGVLLDRARAQAARLAGDLDHARELLAKALVTAKRIGAAPELAYCTLEEGRLELDLDRTRAASVLADARERFSALGMAPWQDRADALARWAGA